MNAPYQLRHARILREFSQSGTTVEDLARAWASLDVKLKQFDAGKDMPPTGRRPSIRPISRIYGHGDYAGYLCEAEEILLRAASYARKRSGADGEPLRSEQNEN